MTRVERSYRGISVRLAVHYLENLGGRLVDSEGDLSEPGSTATVAGDGWRAELDASRRSVGPTLTLTEVQVTFEGEAAALDDLVEAFGRKAMRAGG